MTSGGEDTRILNMRINNKEFLKGTADSLKAVNTLNQGIDSATKGKGIQSLGSGVDTVKTKFGALQIAAGTAIGTITNKLVNAGIGLVKGLTIDPILDGFREYEKLLTSTQTIVANTGVKVGTANKYLAELNKYSDQTVYNFGQMADNIGRFTAAGVKLPDATVAIKGLANAAALAGSSTEQLNTAMYQTSQALSTGVVRLQDWRSLENANLGTENFRKALIETSRVFQTNGNDVDASITKYGSFRESLRTGWLTTDIFTKSMKVFAGATISAKTSTEELVRRGYTPQAIAQIKLGKTVAFSVKELQKMGYTAPGVAKELNRLSQASIDSATKIKTFSQLMDVVKEALGSGWAQIFRRLMGDLGQSSELWTKVGNNITGAMGLAFAAVDDFLKVWLQTKDAKGMTGFAQAWAGIGNIFQVIGNILKPFLVLIDSISPGTSNAGKAAYGATRGFYLFTEALVKISDVTRLITPAFAAVGRAIGFLGEKVQEFIEWFSQFENLFGSIGPSLTRFVESIKAAFETLFDGDFSGFGEQIAAAFGSLGEEGMWIAQSLIDGLVKGLKADSILGAINVLVDRMIEFFKNLLGIHSPSTVTAEIGKNMVDGLAQGLGDSTSSIFTIIGDLIKSVVDKFGEIDKFDLANAFSLLFSAATITVIYKFIKALTQGLNTFKNFGLHIDQLIGETTNTLQAMQQGIKAKALLNIAIALAILAGSLWLLSKIPYPQLVKGLITVSLMLRMMISVMDAMGKNAATTKTAIASMVAMSAAMVLMATAVLILSAAVLAFGNMDVGTLTKGLISVAITLAVLAGASFLLGKAAPTMILAAGGVLILSIALAALAPVIFLFSKISWGTLFSGLLKIGTALILLAVAMIPLSAIAPYLLLASAALVVLSVGLTAMLGVITLFSNVSWGTIIEGATKIGAALIILGLAAIVAAPGLILLGAAAVLLGAGLLAAGLGMTLLGAGLAVVAAAGTAAGAALIATVESFLSILPLMGIQFVSALNLILQALAEKSPAIIDSLVKIGTEILRGISELIPKVVDVGIDLLSALLTGLLSIRDEIYDFGYDMIMGFLKEINRRIRDVTKMGVKIIKGFIKGLGEAASDIVDTAGKTILQYLNALDAAVQKYTPEIVRIGLSIGLHIAEGVLEGLVDTLPGPVKDAVKGLLGIKNNDKGKKSKVDKNARGTDFFRGGLSLVGEMGPELVSMNRGASVITNKNLIAFMKSVSKLSRALSSAQSNVQNSSGGNINYVVSADFQGDPRRNGAAFAANIIDGLSNGLQSRQSGLNTIMSGLGSGVAQAFADILGIQSPSKVFQKYGDYVTQGFIKGLLASTDRVARAAKRLGETAVDAISQTINDNQIKLEAIRGEAEGLAAAIEVLQKISDDEDISEKKKKNIDKQIEALQKEADAAQKAADAQAKLVEEKNELAERQAEFNKADTQGKADIRKEDAAIAAQKASEARQLALSLKKQADLVRKYDEATAKQLDKNAQTALNRATRYANNAQAYALEAQKLYKQVQDEIDAENMRQIQSVTTVDVANAQAAFDAYTKALIEAQTAATQEPQPQNITFEQNNYSPEAISASDAYRNGKSLVSMAERKLQPTP